MRSRTTLLTFFVIASLSLPLAAQAGIPFLGPIIPQGGNQAVCPAGFAMLMVVINNIISFLLTLAIVFVAPLSIAWAGALMVLNPTSLGDIAKAKSILLHTIVGIVVALAGWLIVNALMAVLYNKDAQIPGGGGTLGTWTTLVRTSGADTCIALAGSLRFATPPATPDVSAPGTLNAPPSGKAGTACDPAVVKAAAAAGGYTLTNAQANTLACIAAPESSCGSNLQNYRWNQGTPGSPGSTAYGAFQVLLQTHSNCYENPACYIAAGVTSRLNCATGFSNGNPIPGSTVVQKCVQAASNLNCSASAAACLLQQNGGSFSPWQADINSAIQTGCITGSP